MKILKENLKCFYVGLTSLFGHVFLLFIIFGTTEDGEMAIMHSIKYSIENNGMLLTIGMPLLIIMMSVIFGKLMLGKEIK